MLAAMTQNLLYDVGMSRPIPMYFIAAWLVVWLIGVPLRNRAILQELIGTQPTLLIVAIAVITAIILSVKFMQCERAYVDLALGIVSLQLGFLLTRFIWLTVIANDPVEYRWQYLAIVVMNLFYVTYLMLPSSQKKIAQTRAALLAGHQHKQ